MVMSTSSQSHIFIVTVPQSFYMSFRLVSIWSYCWLFVPFASKKDRIIVIGFCAISPYCSCCYFVGGSDWLWLLRCLLFSMARHHPNDDNNNSSTSLNPYRCLSSAVVPASVNRCISFRMELGNIWLKQFSILWKGIFLCFIINLSSYTQRHSCAPRRARWNSCCFAYLLCPPENGYYGCVLSCGINNRRRKCYDEKSKQGNFPVFYGLGEFCCWLNY